MMMMMPIKGTHVLNSSFLSCWSVCVPISYNDHQQVLHPLKCGHVFHADCLEEHILGYIKEKSLRGLVHCPECLAERATTEPARVLSEEEVKKHVDEAIYEQYQR